MAHRWLIGARPTWHRIVYPEVDSSDQTDHTEIIMSLQELTGLGERLGYKEADLRKFIQDQQASNREEREKERGAEKEARDALEHSQAARQRELELQLQIAQSNKEARENGQAVCSRCNKVAYAQIGKV